MEHLINVLKNRGFIYQATNLKNLEKKMLRCKISAYIGFDCTAKSLHIGSLVQIMFLRWLQRFGHQPVILLGGGTTKIGDPSGKDSMRKIIRVSEIEANKTSIKKILTKFLDFNSKNQAIIVDNSEWLDQLNFIKFLRDFCSHFSINKMLGLESVKLRLNKRKSLSFLEFSYSLLQSFDFYYLYNNKNCILQIGGSDQWGNIISGIELIRKKMQREVFGVTTPLITTSNGIKMGKTEHGAIWLNSEMLSPYKYWQFWRNTEDLQVIKFLKLFTDIPLEQIDKFSNITGKELNDAKILLADEATKICHGVSAALHARSISHEIFKMNNITDNFENYKLDTKIINTGIQLFKLLVLCGFSQSNSDAKRLILGGAIKINNYIIKDISFKIHRNDFNEKKVKLSCGKKKHILIDLESN